MWVGLKKELDEARKKGKIYVNAFCLEQDITTSHFYQVINGNRNPGQKLKKEDLADFLGISVDYIERLVNEGEKSSADIYVENAPGVDNNLGEEKDKYNKKTILSVTSILILILSLITFYYFFVGKNEVKTEKAKKGSRIEGDKSRLVKDVTVADGEFVLANKTFKKVWRIKNTGTTPWKDRFLKRTNIPDESDKTGCSSSEMIPIKDTLPNEEVDVAAYIKPYLMQNTTDGSCITYWKMTDKNGVPFFPNLIPLHSKVGITIYKNKVDLTIYNDMAE